MALSFPTSPTAGQQYVGDGVTYEWNNTLGAWIKLTAVQSALPGAAAQTGAAIIPGGTDAERAAITTPAAGMFRYNDQTAPAVMEYYDGTQWVDLATAGGGGTSIGDWKNVNISGFQVVSRVAYGNGVFVAAGTQVTSGNPLTATSADGYTWTTPAVLTAAPGAGPTALIYANGVFVMAISGGGLLKTYTSPDGATWTAGATLTDSISSIAGTGGTFVAIGGNAKPYVSTDGLNWTFSSTTLPASPDVVACSSSTTYLIGLVDSPAPGRKFFKSTDSGATWTQSYYFTGSNNTNFGSMVWNGSNFVFSIQSGGGQQLGTSADGTSATFKLVTGAAQPNGGQLIVDGSTTWWFPNTGTPVAGSVLSSTDNFTTSIRSGFGSPNASSAATDGTVFVQQINSGGSGAGVAVAKIL